jgi:CheY-like chemotaxis protein
LQQVQWLPAACSQFGPLKEVPALQAAILNERSATALVIVVPDMGFVMGRKEQLNRPTVIVVEDDDDERFLAATLFEELGFGVVECASAEAASVVMDEKLGEIAMIFTDMRLAGRLDGVDLAQLASSKYPEVAVLLTSGNPGERLKHLPEKAEFVQKPWLALDLLRRAERIRAAGNM